MPNTLPLPQPASQTSRGLGARLVRRFGGALRGVVAGIVRLRRRATPPSGATAQPAKDRQASGPHRPRAPRPVMPPRLPPVSTLPYFTPERFPGLSAKACAILSLPLDDCDQEFLRYVVSVLDCYRAATPRMDVVQAGALFAVLWERLGGPLGSAGPGAREDQAFDVLALARTAPPPHSDPNVAAEAIPAALPLSPPEPADMPDEPAGAADIASATAAAEPPDPPSMPATTQAATAPLAAMPNRPNRRRCRPRRQQHKPRDAAIRLGRPGQRQVPPPHISYAARASPR